MAKKLTEAVKRQVMREMASRGGKAEVPKGTAMLPPEERKVRASAAAALKWARYRRDNGLPAKPGDAELLK